MKPTPKQIMQDVDRLSVLRFFPQSEQGRIALAELVDRMVSTVDQLEWLVLTLIDRVGTYLGSDQIRAVFCTKFRPKDGIEANLSSENPLYQTAEQCEERERLHASDEIEAQRYLAIRPGDSRSLPALSEPISAEEAEANRDFALSLIRPVARACEIPAPTESTPGPITQDAIDRARSDYLRGKRQHG
jgi:hypothetical protein